MRAYIGMVINVRTGGTAFSLTRQAIIAADKDEATAELIELASQNLTYDPIKHHPILIDLGRIPENL